MPEVTQPMTLAEAGRRLARTGVRIKWRRLMRSYVVTGPHGEYVGHRATIEGAFELAEQVMKETR